MHFTERKPYKFQDEEERPPTTVGLRDRIAHFTWWAQIDYKAESRD
jgi:hypothetical protein